MGNDNQNEVRTAKPLYQPGVCNIGKSEILRRQRFGFALTLLALFWAMICGVFSLGFLWKLLVIIPSFMGVLGLLQAYFHFCAYYGILGVFNIDREAGATETVLEKQAKLIDRAQAEKILAISSGVALVFTLAVEILL